MRLRSRLIVLLMLVTFLSLAVRVSPANEAMNDTVCTDRCDSEYVACCQANPLPQPGGGGCQLVCAHKHLACVTKCREIIEETD